VPYAEADADFFFGREDDTEIIAANVKTSRLTLLYGASGVGKSSVLLAGVVPRLRELGRERLEGKPTFAVAVLRSWRQAPLANLTNAIRLAVADATGEDVATPSGSSLSETLHGWTERVRTILVLLDQFEDYFLYHDREDGEGTFAVEFPRVINDANLRVNVLLSLREDAWAKLDRFEGQIPNLFGNYVRVNHLSWDAARRAIERPIAKYNDRLPAGEATYAIEPALVDAVLDEVKTGRGLAIGESGTAVEAVSVQLGRPQIETPFLQLVMERLWRATVVARSHELRKQTLVALGGAEKIVKTYLAESLNALDREEQEIAAELFRYLITPSKTKIAHRTSDLAFWTQRSDEELEPVLDKLSRAESDRIRILRPIALPAGEQGSMYEIFHDVLAEPILEWRTQHEQKREKAQLATQVRAEEEERQRESRDRLIRRAAVGLLVLAAVLATLAAIAFVQRGHASTARKVAESRALAADAFTRLAIDPAASVSEAAKAIRIHSTTQAEGALRAGLAESSLRAVAVGSTGAVTSAAFSPVGRRFITASADHSVRVWTWSGRLIHTLHGHTAPVENVAFSRDGTRVIAGGDNGRALIWNASGGGRIVLDGHSGTVVAAFSPDGKRAVTGGEDGLVRVWNASTGDPIAVLHGHTGKITAVGFSPDGTRVVAASADNTATIWRVSRPRARILLHGHTAGLTALAFSQNGDRFATASGDGTARIWQTADGSLIGTLRRGTSGLRDVAFSPNGDLVTASADGSARIWTPNGGLRARLRQGQVLTAAFSPDGSFVVTAGADGIARLWNARTGAIVALLRGHTAPLSAASFSPDGTRVLTASADQTARVWAVPRPAEVSVLGNNSTTSGSMLAAAFDAAGMVVTADALGKVSTWAASARRRATSHAAASSASAAAFSADGKLAAIIGGDGRTHLWDVEGHHSLRRLPDTAPVVAAAFSADDKWVVAAGTDGVVRVFDVETGRLRRAVHTAIGSVNANVNAAALSPDGKLLVTGGDGIAQVWDVSNGRRIASLPGHTGPVLAVGYSPDSQLVATGGFDGTVRLWNAATWRPLAVLRGHVGPVRNVAFDPVGNVVATAGADRTVRIWETSSGRELAVFRGRTSQVQTAAFSPDFSSDGTQILTAGLDGTVRIYACDVCGLLKHLLELAGRVPSNG
jgi:WD40 repeat protein